MLLIIDYSIYNKLQTAFQNKTVYGSVIQYLPKT